MDIQHLVDRLEDLIDEGRHIFGTRFTMIDEERALELIDQMRISIPEEIEKSRRILQQRERILSEAHEESARIVQQNRNKAEQMLEHDETVQKAHARADQIVEQARRESERITLEADQYVMDTLGRLENLLLRDLTEVRNGINVVQNQFSAAVPEAPEPVQMPVMEDETQEQQPISIPEDVLAGENS
ncbi:MAG: hypothetical protein ACPG7F_17330 [Aggregatilineales bacterium]